MFKLINKVFICRNESGFISCFEMLKLCVIFYLQTILKLVKNLKILTMRFHSFSQILHNFLEAYVTVENSVLT